MAHRVLDGSRRGPGLRRGLRGLSPASPGTHRRGRGDLQVRHLRPAAAGRSGPPAGSACSATRAIRWCRSWPRAPRWPSRTPRSWPGVLTRDRAGRCSRRAAALRPHPAGTHEPHAVWLARRYLRHLGYARLGLRLRRLLRAAVRARVTGPAAVSRSAGAGLPAACSRAAVPPSAALAITSRIALTTATSTIFPSGTGDHADAVSAGPVESGDDLRAGLGHLFGRRREDLVQNRHLRGVDRGPGRGSPARSSAAVLVRRAARSVKVDRRRARRAPRSAPRPRHDDLQPQRAEDLQPGLESTPSSAARSASPTPRRTTRGADASSARPASPGPSRSQERPGGRLAGQVRAPAR